MPPPGIEDLVAKLHAQGKKVYLVSGGFRQIIEPVAELLKIPKSRIFANNILYKVSPITEVPVISMLHMCCLDARLKCCPYATCAVPQPDGSYAGFDKEEFTSRSGGKPAALRHIKVEPMSHRDL